MKYFEYYLIEGIKYKVVWFGNSICRLVDRWGYIFYMTYDEIEEGVKINRETFGR